jgi:hypothetical protein
MIKVSQTKFANLKRGDILMYRAGDLLWPEWDVLGNLITSLEGNTGTARDPKALGYSSGDYTHCAWLRDLPDPDAEVEELPDRPGIYKIKDGATWIEEELVPGRWDEEQLVAKKRLTSLMPIRVHATWPCVLEETIDLENLHMEVWRMRRATPEIIEGVLKLANDMIGWQYDLADFLTFGNLHLPSAKICSEFIADIAYNASMLRSNDYPICLTPDIAGNADKQKTPNDLINSGELIKIDFQGLL